MPPLALSRRYWKAKSSGFFYSVLPKSIESRICHHLSFLLNVITAWHIKPNTREKQPPPNSDAPHPAPDIVIKPPKGGGCERDPHPPGFPTGEPGLRQPPVQKPAVFCSRCQKTHSASPSDLRLRQSPPGPELCRAICSCCGSYVEILQSSRVGQIYAQGPQHQGAHLPLLHWRGSALASSGGKLAAEG